MSRVKSGAHTRRKRKKVLKLAEGYRGAQSKLYRTAQEKVARALQFAFRDRRVKKRDFRSLWITRIGIAAKLNGLNYSKFIQGLKIAGINLDRKILSELAINKPQVFTEIVNVVKSKLAA